VESKEAIPRPVAIVMDGNGRWANRRFMPRFFGHKRGVETVVKTVLACAERGIEFLTIYAFSSENWKRPADEVSGLMDLVPVAVAKYLNQLHAAGVRIRIIGDRERLSDRLRSAWDHAESLTRDNRRISLNVAFSYGGRWDIVQACRAAMRDGADPDSFDEATLSRYLSLSYAPDPDLFIRTGGELRISNFLLWQVAYAEFVFSDCLWPDFDEGQLDLALAQFARRERRFGDAKDKVPSAIAPGA
jgi:undecaprenyl diphosphate synthase